MANKVPYSGEDRAFRANDVIVTGGGPGPDTGPDHVLLMLAFVQDNLDHPVGKIAFHASPQRAREIARELIHYAYFVEENG